MRGAVLATLLAVAAAGCGENAAEAESAHTRRASDFRSERLETVLEETERVIQTRGFAADGDEWRGFLVDQASQVDEASLRAGTCYLVIGVGSSALSELSLRIYDSDGGEVAQDTRPGSNAALHYCPAHTGTYYVGALATRGTGLFAVRRYAGPTGLEIRLDDLFGEPAGSEGLAPERP